MASEQTPEPRQIEPQGAPTEETHGRGTSDNLGLFYWYWWRRGSLPPALLMLTPSGALVESDPSTVLDPRVRDQHLQFLDPIITPLLQDERLTFDELRAAIESRRRPDNDDPDRRFDSDRRGRLRAGLGDDEVVAAFSPARVASARSQTRQAPAPSSSRVVRAPALLRDACGVHLKRAENGLPGPSTSRYRDRLRTALERRV